MNNSIQNNLSKQNKTAFSYCLAITGYEIGRNWKITLMGVFAVYILKYFGAWLGGNPTPSEMAGNGLSFLLFLSPVMILYLFSGAIASERQRGTLGLFITSSVPRYALGAGKLIAAVILTAAYFLLALPAATPGRIFTLSWIPVIWSTSSGILFTVSMIGFFMAAASFFISVIASGTVPSFIISGMLSGGFFSVLAFLNPRDGFIAALLVMGLILLIASFKILYRGDVLDQKRMFLKGLPICLSILIACPLTLMAVTSWREAHHPPLSGNYRILEGRDSANSGTFITGLREGRYALNTWRETGSCWDMPFSSATGSLIVDEVEKRDQKTGLIQISKISYPNRNRKRNTMIMSVSPDGAQLLLEAPSQTLGFYSRATEVLRAERGKVPVSLGEFHDLALATWMQDNSLAICWIDNSREDDRSLAEKQGGNLFRFKIVNGQNSIELPEIICKSIVRLVPRADGSIMICTITSENSQRVWMALSSSANSAWEQIPSLANHEFVASDMKTGRLVTRNLNNGDYCLTTPQTPLPAVIHSSPDSFRLKEKVFNVCRFHPRGLSLITMEERGGTKKLIISRHHEQEPEKIITVEAGLSRILDINISEDGQNIALLVFGDNFEQINDKLKKLAEELRDQAPRFISHKLFENFWRDNPLEVKTLAARLDGMPAKSDLENGFSVLTTFNQNTGTAACKWISNDTLALSNGKDIFELTPSL